MTNEKALTKADFPPVEELPRYGRDVPVPTSFDELRCKYNEKEPCPPLKLEELEGYCVPPDGIVIVAVHGGGLKSGQGAMVYRPGTFREDRHTAGKEFGKSHKELTMLRHQGRKEKVLDGLAPLLAEKGYLAIADVIDKDPEVIAAVMSWAFEIIDGAKNPREALNLATYLWDKLDHEQSILDNLGKSDNPLAEKSMDVLKQMAGIDDELIAKEKGEIIDAKLYDVEDE